MTFCQVLLNPSIGCFHASSVQAEMIARDKEREKAKLEQQAEAAKKNEEARVKAEARIAAALETNANILAKRRTEFDAKEKEAEARRQ